MKPFAILAIAIVANLPALAQAQHSPYAGQEARDIKALSADEVTQYLAGAGMRFALAAELNRYPGPMHVLELADKLALTPEQRAATANLMSEHKAEASAIGGRMVEAERMLDQLFASGKADRAALAQQVSRVAALHGEYRLSHLDTHVRMRAMLTGEQVNRYVALRGYEGGAPLQHKQHH